ncbi:MAG: prenyltransferase [Candidatus Omnitrophica bacterium]|nr:prenyltransferase [Candidatus Omnitrophota bacterium]
MSASILPFIFGSLIETQHFNFFAFLLGVCAVLFCHLSANLINDYADSKSGADWQDRNFYGLFGGSKLIQERVFSERFYLILAIMCFSISALSVGLLAIVLQQRTVILYYCCIMVLSWSYSMKPLRFSYRRMGEVVIFLLFGPALVMGGYYIQTGIFPDMKSFILSLPLGLFVTAILFANEVPDFSEDQKAGKLTLVSIVSAKRAFLLYLGFMAAAFIIIAVSFSLGYLNPLALLAFILIVPVWKAAQRIRIFFHDKQQLIESSRLTIMIQTVASLALILGVLF